MADSRTSSDQGGRALQTRACFLRPERFESEAGLRSTVEELAERGYNTVIVPVLHEGRITFSADAAGGLRGNRCPAVRALRVLDEAGMSFWLSVDPLLAGPAGGRALGTLARRHRDWLMKNIDGEFALGVRGGVPGLFCWTVHEFRWLLGNLLAGLFQGYAAAGLVFDLRYLPRTTLNPATWTHLGANCLSRVRRELGIDLEDFLARPTTSQHNAICQWRQRELVHFLEALKARARHMGGEIPALVLAGLEDPANPHAPWGPLYRNGVVDSVLLEAPSDQLAAHVAALDVVAGPTPRPYLPTVGTEAELAALGRVLPRMGAHGYCVLAPGSLRTEKRPAAPLRWNMPGAVENHPAEALELLLEGLEELLETLPALRDLLAMLPRLADGRLDIANHAALQEWRERLVARLVQWREGDDGSDDARVLALARLEMVARLLVLAPISCCEAM
jgi:hypothetical protein